MQSMTFKQVMDRDVDETFLNVAEFADLHNIDGNGITDTATGNTAVGYAAASATAEDTKILVKLDG